MLRNFQNKFLKNNEIFLKIKVHPHAKITMIKEILPDNTIKVDVSASPEKGQANQKLIKYLAQEFKVNKNSIKIVSGVGKRVKLIKIINSVT